MTTTRLMRRVRYPCAHLSFVTAITFVIFRLNRAPLRTKPQAWKAPEGGLTPDHLYPPLDTERDCARVCVQDSLVPLEGSAVSRCVSQCVSVGVQWVCMWVRARSSCPPQVLREFADPDRHRARITARQTRESSARRSRCTRRDRRRIPRRFRRSWWTSPPPG